jgi:nucleoside-diphosphate-sugar epimerase
MQENIIVIGGAGNVGKGICEAIERSHIYSPFAIDPQINKTFEEFSTDDLGSILRSTKAIIYTADNGNRDDYEKDPELQKRNADRFQKFCKRLSDLTKKVPVWYVGGSWTKRKPDINWVVTDDSPNKDFAEMNAYEKAKAEVEKYASVCSKDLGINIQFVDYISIVPNLSPNFSICKMVKEAVEQGIIHYSAGDYGRPLLDAISAGNYLLKLIELNNIDTKAFLIPGIFISFKEFAETVQKVVKEKTGKDIKLVPQETTPDFLKTKIEFPLRAQLGFELSKEKVMAALVENAERVLANY